MNALSKSLNGTFRKVVMGLEKARSEDVPTYAPKAFNSALECYGRARQKFANLETPDEINGSWNRFLKSSRRPE